MTANEFLAMAVADGGVDEIDSEVEHLVQQMPDFGVGQHWTAAVLGTAQLHCAVPEDGHLGSGASEHSISKSHWRFLRVGATAQNIRRAPQNGTYQFRNWQVLSSQRRWRVSVEQIRSGRKRDSSRDIAILTAALDVLAETGYERMTTDMVAARAGASKATMYRRWPSKAVLVIEAVERLRTEPFAEPPDTGTLLDDLASLLDPSGTGPASQKFDVMTGLLSVLPHNADLASAVQRRIVQPRTAAIRIAVSREQDRGGIERTRNPDTLAVVVAAMITYRLLVTREPVDRQFLNMLITDVLRP